MAKYNNRFVDITFVSVAACTVINDVFFFLFSAFQWNQYDNHGKGKRKVDDNKSKARDTRAKSLVHP